jgi:hypothetical protein
MFRVLIVSWLAIPTLVPSAEGCRCHAETASPACATGPCCESHGETHVGDRAAGDGHAQWLTPKDGPGEGRRCPVCALVRIDRTCNGTEQRTETRAARHSPVEARRMAGTVKTAGHRETASVSAGAIDLPVGATGRLFI